jgi:tetratricopeptide (TPR) repeat protein
MSLASRHRRIVVIVAGCLLAAVVLGFSPYFLHEARPTEPLFDGLGPYTRKITTSSPLAQRYFDQGLAFFYGYNFDEAIRSFQAATVCDPHCAMAFWGVGMASFEYVYDPTLDATQARLPLDATATARSLESNASPVERALIEALAQRYSERPPPDRDPLDREYYFAMRRAWKAFPDDADVGALAAQALMVTQHGKQWAPNGAPLPDTEELLALIDRVLAKAPDHPFASHLLIHAIEASPHPEKGDQAADRLRHYDAPGLAHLTHMPSHIDIRRGRWEEAVAVSEKAVAADAVYRKIAQPTRYYWIVMAHDNHMLSYAAAMQGESQKATDAIRGMIADYFSAEASSKFRTTADGFLAMPYEIDLRFGRWDAMLAQPKPDAKFPVATALWHFGRGVAFAAKNRIAEARAEGSEFLNAKDAVPEAATFRYTPAAALLGVAEKMLAGEILYREGKVDKSIAALKVAIEREDNLPYSEPPDWFQPVRHVLASVLLDARRYPEAEAVCREDLVRHPENGWSLFGLAQSLQKQKKTAEAKDVTARFKRVWQHADFKLTAPCLCLPAKE